MTSRRAATTVRIALAVAAGAIALLVVAAVLVSEGFDGEASAARFSDDSTAHEREPASVALEALPFEHLPLEQRQALAQPVGVPSETAEPAARRVVVLSRANLPLASVDYRADDGAWHSATSLGAASSEGFVLELSPYWTETFVKAPGHLATLVASDRVELEPDALVEIEMPGLAASVTALELPQGFGPSATEDLAECASWSFTGPDRFVVAVGVPGFVGTFVDAHFDFGLELGGHETLEVAALLHEGLRARAVLPARVAEVQLAPLGVELRSRDDLSHQTTKLTIWTHPDEERSLGTWSFDWGTVQLTTKQRVAELSVFAHEAATALLVVGTRYRIAAEAENGAAGSVDFTHDGETVAIDLLSGVRLFGVFDGRGENLPPTARARWHWSKSGSSDGPESWYRWLGDSTSFLIADDGEFELVAPRRGFPGRPPRNPSPPASIAISFRVGGFSTLELEVELEGSHEVDLGTILLQREQADLILRWHPFRDGEDIQWSPVCVAQDAVPGSFEVAAERAGENGRIEVFLTRRAAAEPPENLIYRDSAGGQRDVSFPVPPPPVIVVYGRQDGVDGTVPILFARAKGESSPTYDWIEGRHRTVQVDYAGAPPEAISVHMGWTWGGVFVPTRSVREELDLARSFEFTFEAPDDASFWWTWATKDAFVWPPASSRRLLEDSELVRIPD